jgi:HAD superfamily hydrolase (TIGR01509 family)
VPEAGALAAAVMAASGVTRHICVGKPEPLLFEAACHRLGIAPREAIMIGDNADTDGEGARRLGMAFVQVRNGDIRSGFDVPLKIAV